MAGSIFRTRRNVGLNTLMDTFHTFFNIFLPLKIVHLRESLRNGWMYTNE